MNKPSNNKERGLIKGAIRRIFSRSELRAKIILKHTIEHSDPNRPRVTKWGWCAECGIIEARYLLEVDHMLPVVPLNKSLEEMNWDELVDRVWCEESSLQACCKSCHKAKSKAENSERRKLKKGKK